ncbi:hypothetical protein [Erythrobacter sp.]|uniref:hypothetical protein n=1 Tax=Erythrobacter sp. TaxID=1042 RepID=UPI002EA1D7F1|nr:hypothetical protein [Erythrobacter sp.]
MTACGGPVAGDGPGGVSEGEARALDEAAQMLEEKRLPEGVIPDRAPATGAPAVQAPPDRQDTESSE